MMRVTWVELGLVCLGGALGSGLRHLLASSLTAMLPANFAWGIWGVNVLGCFALGVLMGANAAPPLLRISLGSGVLGGFTTYSSFNQGVIALAATGKTGAAAAYLGGTVIACLVAGAAGTWTALAFTK